MGAAVTTGRNVKPAFNTWVVGDHIHATKLPYNHNIESDFLLVPKFKLGNAVFEAPASRRRARTSKNLQGIGSLLG